jgi:tRNA nucleotidyltransferase (CCA-adding enzyme)
MPEYIYLLENRLSAAQKNALAQVRDAAREAGLTVFLAGGAVRDLTTGSSVRDLDFSVQGDVLGLEKALQARGGTFWGRHEASRTLFFWFPGSVRVEITSTRTETFPKPGKPVYSWSSVVADLHRRDFTANAMAVSLNEGSYGLLLDPLNGTADIDARHLRLVSNYGFLEDPARLVRAVRLAHRLGWQMEERTAQRYQNAKEDGDFDAISPFLRGYELEKIACEDEALSTLKALETEGWMKKLFPAWTSASVDTAALEDLHRNRIQLLMQGVSPDLAAAHLEILTAKMPAADRKTLKSTLVRPGLLAQWEGLEAAAKEFGRLLTNKEAATPSATWKLFHSHAAEPILWLAHQKKTPAAEAKFKNFFSVWPEVAKKVPVAMMLEMRITPELPAYAELLHQLFLQQIDENLETDELMRAFLEPYSPPAPPPPVTLKRSRAKKADAKGKKKAVRDEDDEDEDDEDDTPKRRIRGDEEDEDDEDSDEAVVADLPDPSEESDEPDDESSDEDSTDPGSKSKSTSKTGKNDLGDSEDDDDDPPPPARLPRPAVLSKRAAAVKAVAAKPEPESKSQAKALAVADPVKTAVTGTPARTTTTKSVAAVKTAAKAPPVEKPVAAKPVPVKTASVKPEPAPRAEKAATKALAKASPNVAGKAEAKPAVKALVKAPAKAAAVASTKDMKVAAKSGLSTKVPIKSAVKETKVTSAKAKPGAKPGVKTAAKPAAKAQKK